MDMLSNGEEIKTQDNNKKTEKIKARIEIAEYLANTKQISLIMITFFTAIWYSICFTGYDIYPQLSLTLFSISLVVILYFCLNTIGFLKNKKAFFWSVPIILISVFNSIFYLDTMGYSNAVIIMILFAIMSHSAVSDKIDYDKNSFALDIIIVIIGDISKSIECTKVLVPKNDGAKNIMKQILLGIVIAIPVLIVVLNLMLSADMVFNKIFFDILNSNSGNEIIRHAVIIIITFIYGIGYVLNLKRAASPKGEELKGNRITSITFLSILNFLFLTFCLVQITYLFTGGYKTLPEGLVYSEYARQGFFELLFITVINFSVLIVFLKLFSDCTQFKAVNRLLILLSIFTLVLIYSSFYRMNMYIQVYNYTPLRLSVITFLFMETVLIVITLLYLTRRTSVLIKPFIVTCIVFSIVFNITSSNIVTTLLNINYMKDYNLDVYVSNIDSAGILINLHYKLGDSPEEKELKKDIVRRITGLEEKRLYNPSEWQNYSFFARANESKIKAFLKESESYTNSF